jgi:hypothetical protein
LGINGTENRCKPSNQSVPVEKLRIFATKSVFQAFRGFQLLQKLVAKIDLFAASFARILPS